MRIEDIIDVDALPEWARSVLMRPPQSRRDWTDADWAANEARINMLNAGMPGAVAGDLLPPRMPRPPRPPPQAPDPDRAAPLFMRSASMPASPDEEPDRLIVRDPRATGFPLREGASRDDILSNLARLGAQITPQHSAYWANVMAPHLASMLRGERNPAAVAYERSATALARGELPASGKVPPMDGLDPRLAPAILEAMGLGSSFLPFGWATRAPVVAERVLPLAERALPSKSPFMYNPPPKPLRPFELDYPHGARADAAGRLTHDIEGRPLTAPFVAGRTTVGGVDEAIGTLEKFDALATQGVGQKATYHPAREMGGDFGQTLVNDVTGRPIAIKIREGMRPDKVPMVYAHEIGHVIDEIAGQIPTKGIAQELRGIYNTLNNPNRARGGLEAAPWGKPMTPQGLGYRGDEIPRELMVEAIRAYKADPNYIKTVAPQTAARIREYVNSHPELSKIIQFNALIGAPAMGAIYGRRDAD